MADAVSVVEYLHRRSIVGKTIKSLNFLLVNNVLKISDFGMAAAALLRVYDSKAAAAPMGPARWLAPECNGRTPFTDKSDVFALGMVFPFSSFSPFPPLSFPRMLLVSYSFLLPFSFLFQVIWELLEKKVPFGDKTPEDQVMLAIKIEKKRPPLSSECDQGTFFNLFPLLSRRGGGESIYLTLCTLC